MGILRRIARSLQRGKELSGRLRALETLRLMSDERLVELGFSPEMIARGVDAWPWRLKSSPLPEHAHLTTGSRGAEPEIRTLPETSLGDPTIAGGEFPVHP